VEVEVLVVAAAFAVAGGANESVHNNSHRWNINSGGSKLKASFS